MDWEQGELRNIRVKPPRRRPGGAQDWVDLMIPAPYDRIVAQMISEDCYATIHSEHEAVRRQSYAIETLEEFCK